MGRDPKCVREREPVKNVVMVVDDESDIRQVLSDLLTLEGYSVMLARNGREALDLIVDITPCLILLDLMMPIMDGYQFLDAWNADPRSNDVAVIVSTAGHVEKPLRVNGVLPKPLDLAKLESMLELYCCA